ncbi:FtsX-like permease family protein [Streptomyces sp. DH12]|uniref:FtsX-like permease family protein n=1 Tax=Streptomyces sp. DH12 TaxID=2857010 RepID=UPI001E31F34B|nr:FtsX-like permease family protein [Streptomyces sp. DH12]
MTGPRGAVRDLLLGARFAVTGGRRSWARTALTAVGVGLGVALLLVAASIPHMLDGREARTDGRQVSFDEAPVSARSFRYVELSTLYRADTVHGVALRPDGPDAPVPPGLAALPGPGEMAVSPALAELLASPEGALLKDRFPYRQVGTIGDAGLAGPGELFLYAHDPAVADAPRAGRADRFGQGTGERPLEGPLLLVVILACVVLLLPVLVFVAVAVRFGGEQRDRRLAALRLVGADAGTTRRAAAGEALAGAVLGMVVGGVFFLLGREFAGRVTVWNVNAFPGDIVPEPALAAAVVSAVPLCALVVTLLALRGVVVEPLGVVRGGAPRPRRLWWRLVLAASGLALLLPAGRLYGEDTTYDTYRVAVGALLALTGFTALLPWLVEAAVRPLRGGPPSWQLAVRRLQLGSGTAARAVGGIVVAAAGAIALLMVFGAVQSDFMRPTTMDVARAQLRVWSASGDVRTARELIDEVGAAPGVEGVVGLVEAGARRPGPLRAGESFVPRTALTVAECPSLRELGELPSCRDGDVFIARTHGVEGPDDAYLAETARPGALVDLRDEDERPVLWRVPATARLVDARRDPMGEMPFGIYATPGVLDAAALPADAETVAMVRLDPAVADAAEHARNAAARVDPLARVRALQDVERDGRYTSVRRGVLAAASATMGLIALSLLVSMVEQLRERRGPLAALVAFGTRRSTLGWSVLWQTALPVGLGLVISVAGGLALGAALLRMIDKTVVDWWVFLPVVGVGAGLVLVVTLLSLPALWRLMRPDGLRTE